MDERWMHERMDRLKICTGVCRIPTIVEFVDIELAYIRFDIANARFSW